jgi:hypothetical protein
LFNAGNTISIPTILLSKLPGFLVAIEEFLKGGSRFENEIKAFVFHYSIEALDEGNVIGFWIKLHELDNGIRALLVATLSELDATLASAFSCSRYAIYLKVESHDGFLWLIG